jgi:hypothetical protein
MAAESRVSQYLYMGRMLFFALGILVLCAGLCFGLFSWGTTHGGIRTKGIITNLRQDKEGYWFPEFTYQDEQGQKQTVHSWSGRIPAGFVKGEEVPVIYQKGHAGSGVIATWGELWMGAVICGIVGIGAIGSGILVGLVERAASLSKA